MGTTTLDNCLKVSYKAKSVVPATINCAPRFLPKRSENINPRKDLYRNVYCSPVHNTPKLERTQITFNKIMEK